MKSIALLALATGVLLAADGEVHKTPYELIDLSLDFVARAPNGITIDSVTVLNANTGADDTAAILVVAPATPVPAVQPGTMKVVIRVKGGADGKNENILIRVIRTDTGEKLEGNIMLMVANRK